MTGYLFQRRRALAGLLQPAMAHKVCTGKSDKSMVSDMGASCIYRDFSHREEQARKCDLGVAVWVFACSYGNVGPWE